MTSATQQRISSIMRQIGSIAAIVVALIPQVPLPGPWSRVALVVVGGILQVTEHYLSDPSTGNTTPPTSTDSTPGTPPIVPPTQ
jgi:hypothetical protein